jgi:hypothetical protein
MAGVGASAFLVALPSGAAASSGTVIAHKRGKSLQRKTGHVHATRPDQIPIEPDPDELLDPDAPLNPDDPDLPDGPDSATPLVPADPENGTRRM